MPWYGEITTYAPYWIPRRMLYEFCKLMTLQDLGNDPNAWEAWFKAHPDLVWDEKLECLVEAAPKVVTP